MHTPVLPASKLATLADVAAHLARRWSVIEDQRLGRDLLAEGLRKLHDNASCGRGRGKFRGHVHWSQDALRLLNTAGGSLKKVRSQLSHEHVVPISIVIKRLLILGQQAAPADCETVIAHFSVVAIITREQNATLRAFDRMRTLAEGWEEADVWARYKGAGLHAQITDA